MRACSRTGASSTTGTTGSNTQDDRPLRKQRGRSAGRCFGLEAGFHDRVGASGCGPTHGIGAGRLCEPVRRESFVPKIPEETRTGYRRKGQVHASARGAGQGGRHETKLLVGMRVGVLFVRLRRTAALATMGGLYRDVPIIAQAQDPSGIAGGRYGDDQESGGREPA